METREKGRVLRRRIFRFRVFEADVVELKLAGARKGHVRDVMRIVCFMMATLLIPFGMKFNMASNARCEGSVGEDEDEDKRKDMAGMMNERTEDVVLFRPSDDDDGEDCALPESGTRKRLSGISEASRRVSDSLISRTPDPPVFLHKRDTRSAHWRTAARRRVPFISFVTEEFKRIVQIAGRTPVGTGNSW